ncbi:uncharacterized protein LOC111670453 [Seriola lalandi dorsalis]|uniref:uncharacterized protein LOC111670453 n=1 Tax=Seriola lalandi dorsalis TaxID=1841481 RepID=UPI000C6F5F4F|nr:uncharacterized protein LOC111670453 [Seriola lalandi dorsalis]
MKLLLSSLLLASLCAISSWTASSTGVLTQTPDVSVLEGETVNITCCWKGTFDRITFNWGRNQTDIKPGQYNSTPQSEESNSCSTLTFSNITTNDSGKYTCIVNVEIPFYVQVKGNGTIITVRTRENRGNDTDDDRGEDQGKSIPLSIKIATAVVVPLLLITLIYFCSLRRRQAQAARVIYEVPHVDSEVAEMDKHSTSSSRGSSQWCQVPVYESFDYFERVQTKESG